MDAAAKTQPSRHSMRTRKRRAIATRAAAVYESSGEPGDRDAGKKSRRVAVRGASDSEQQELAQIQHECALIDAVCAAVSNEKHGSRSAQHKCGRKSRHGGNAATMTTEVENKQVQNGGRLVLCDVGERVMMSFLPALPGRLKAESVCKRWRHMSLREVPLQELDFDKVVLRSITKKGVLQILQRSNGQLRRLVLPDMQIDDAIVQCIASQMDLQFFRAHRLQKKHIFQILQHCKKLESLELLDCQALQLAGWKHDPGAVSLQKVYLNGCDYLTNSAAQSLIQMCGRGLKKFILTGAVNVDSGIFSCLARNAVALSELTMSHCRHVRVRDLTILMETLWETLSWLDFSFCGGISLFPESPTLPMLQVLMLDKTKINDDGLKAIARIAPHLKYLSLQDCRCISDEGILALASPEGCLNLELIDLKGTSVTDQSIIELEEACVHLRMVRLDSCRSISREMRLKYSERARGIVFSGEMNEYERISMGRKKVELVDDEQSNTESASDSDCDEHSDVA